MLRGLHIPVRLAFVAELFSFGAFAEDRYVVKVTGDVNAIAQRHGLQVVKTLTGSASGHYVLSSSNLDPATVLRNLKMEFAVRTAEPDVPVQLPGITAKTQVHPASAGGTFQKISSSMVMYYRAAAPSAYVTQAAGTVINLVKAHGLATGNGAVIATIDTGVDFSQPARSEE